MIRIAKIEDFDIISNLVLMASSSVFEYILKNSNKEEHQKLLKKYYFSESRFNYKNILIYLINEEIVGMVVFYPSAREKQYNTIMTESPQVYEAIENTIYIDSIAVNENYQKQGIAQKLISYVINNTIKDVSLLVEKSKPNVQSYYTKIGFEYIDEIILYNTKFSRMVFKNNGTI